MILTIALMNPIAAYAETDLQHALRHMIGMIDGLLETGQQDLSTSPPKTKPYDRLVRNAAKRYRMDPLLIHAIIEQESAYDRFAISTKGARGLMQLMPETQRDLGVEDPFNPAENIRGGTRFFRQMLNRFGSYSKALMAYNCGPGNFEKGSIPKESREYASRVITTWNRSRQGE